jgi:hypothetical protein
VVVVVVPPMQTLKMVEGVVPAAVQPGALVQQASVGEQQVAVEAHKRLVVGLEGLEQELAKLEKWTVVILVEMVDLMLQEVLKLAAGPEARLVVGPEVLPQLQPVEPAEVGVLDTLVAVAGVEERLVKLVEAEEVDRIILEVWLVPL